MSTSRREFLKTISGAAASALVLGACTPGGDGDNGGTSLPPDTQTPQALAPRTGKANPYVTADGKPILVSVQGTDFSQMLASGLSLLGGLAPLIGGAENVFVNPNCNHAEPFPGISDAASVGGVVSEIRQVTSGSVTVGDSGWESPTGVYNFMGLPAAVENAGGTLVSLSATHPVRQADWSSSKPDFRVYTDVYDAPVLISTCVLKRHNTARLTCAIKNNVGAVDGPGASMTRDYLHHQSPDFFSDVADIASLANPDLVIVDARQILTVAGPMISNGGVIVDVGKVVICGDIVAADAYCSGIMETHDPGFSIEDIRTTLQRAETLGLGTADLSQVEILEITA